MSMPAMLGNICSTGSSPSSNHCGEKAVATPGVGPNHQVSRAEYRHGGNIPQPISRVAAVGAMPSKQHDEYAEARR